jgi:MFS family permease
MQRRPDDAEMTAATWRASLALLAVNFFMADIQAGIGPFLGVFLLTHHWGTGAIGSVMTAGGVAGMACTAPAGALVDQSRHKRLLVVGTGLCTAVASLLLLLSQRVGVVALSQLATAVAGAVVVPAVSGITLGVVRQRGFSRQIGRNQALNHAGNMIGAVLGGVLGWKLGLGAVFWLDAAFGGLAIGAVLLIPPRAIDDRAARGLAEDGDTAGAAPEGFRVLARNRPMLILAACLASFHLGNAAMLPLYGMAVSSAGHANPALFTGATIAVAQAVMVATALIAMRMAERLGYWLVMLVTFLVLPIRGVTAAWLQQAWGVFPVQALDGIGAGLQSVAVPGLVARLLRGSGRFNVGLGAVMTAQGLGAALSPALGGWIAAGAGYRVAFLVLGACSMVALGLWLGFARLLRPACAGEAAEMP